MALLNRPKIGSSQIPNEGSCHKAHNFFWYKIRKGSAAIFLARFREMFAMVDGAAGAAGRKKSRTAT
jgi:hypothetical protein